MTIFVAILGLGLLVFIHELGHFTVSLALGMRPRRFYVGLPAGDLEDERGGGSNTASARFRSAAS